MVASIKSHDELLCFLFSMLSIWFVFDYFDTRKTWWLTLSVK